MSRIIAIANQKGGVAKTTTAMNLGIGLAGKGARVLIIDNDPQSSLTVAMGFHHPEQLICTLASAMQHVIQNEEFDPRESIIMHGEGVDFIPSNALLNEMEGQLITVLGDMPQRVKGMKCNYIPTARQFVKQQRLQPLCAAIFHFSSPGSSGRGYWGRNGTMMSVKMNFVL